MFSSLLSFAARLPLVRLLTLLALLWLPRLPRLSFAEADRVAGFHAEAVAITNARIVVQPGEVIEKGNLILRDGLIAAVGPDAAVPADADVIDGEGLTVYAGFIDAATSQLLDKDKTPQPGAGRTVDFNRYALAATRPDHRNSLTPEFHAAEGLKLEADEMTKLRQSGFTALHVVPSGRVASGQGSLIALSGGPLREIVMQPSTMSEFQLFGPRGDVYPSTLMGAHAHLRQAFLDAAHHARHRALFTDGVAGLERPANDPALESLQAVRTGEQTAMFLATSRDDLERALNFAAEHKLKAAVWGAADAWRWTDRLKEQQVGVIAQVDFGDEPKIEPPKDSGKLQAEVKDPLRVQEDRLRKWKERIAGLAELEKRQIPFALSSRNLKSQGDVLKSLRLAIAQGLSRDAALAALTTNAARLLNLEDRLGTLAPGKLAHVVMLTGPFDHEQSKVRYVLIDGEKFEYNPDAKPVEPKPDANDGPNLAGKWRMEIASATGKVTAQLELAQTGKRLNGSFTSEQGDGKLTTGTTKADGIEFTVGIGAGDRAVELQFSGKLADGKLSGQLKSAFGAATDWTATRIAEKTAERNPVELVGADATEPENATSLSRDAQRSAPQQSTELTTDRTARPIKTGGHVLIQNATVLTGTGQTLPNTSILVRNGKIAAIGPDLTADDGMMVIDATGRFVMPGIIDTHSHIMIGDGLGSVNEATLSIVPEVRVRDSIRTDDVAEYRALAGGTTTVRLLHGSANVIGGQDAVIKLKHGATAAEHLVPNAPQGVKFALGENVKFRTNRFPTTRMGVEATLNRAFLEAVDYRRRWLEYERNHKDDANSLPPRRDLRLEALADIVNHQKFIHSHCYRADEILMLLRVASNLGIRVWSLQHVLEGYKVAPEIVAHGASCSTFSDWWAYKVEAYDATPYNAALLREAGANIVFKSDDHELVRHLYIEASKGVRYGNIPPDYALQMVTLNSARELGLDDRLGSIEIGKDADLAIFNGHPLSIFSRCEQTVIDGEIVFTRAKQPTVMSENAVERTARAPKLDLPKAEERVARIDVPESPNHRYAIIGAVLHPVDGPEIPNGVLLIEGDRIAALGSNLDVPKQTTIVDAKGLHVYPGLIDAGTTLGLTEIGKVRETHDYAEGGQMQPDLKAGVAVNVDSELIPVARSGGITTALLRPAGGLIAGQASLITLAGWTAPEMVLDYEAALQINWPSGKETKKEIEQLRDFLQEGRIYDKARSQSEKDGELRPLTDPRFEALRPYLRGEKRVFIEANTRQHIAEALLFAEKEKLKIVITGGTEAWKLADELKKRDVPVILGPVMRAPMAEYDPFDAPYANAGRLHEAGVKFCIRSDSASNSRNAPFEAGMAVAYGLPEEEGLKAVTLGAAEILNLADRVGSLSVGKLANLVITDGSPLQPTTQLKAVLIQGRPYSLEDRQTRFYEKYRRRLHELRGTSPSQPAPLTKADAASE